jgi:hypothetical protein
VRLYRRFCYVEVSGHKAEVFRQCRHKAFTLCISGKCPCQETPQRITFIW